MQVISKISVDLRHPINGARVDAVQNDVNTRVVEISLFDGGAAWSVPAGITAAVGYRKPDNKKGIYDKLADGTAAVTISGSTITIILAQQMLTTPGEVSACIVLNDENLNKLTSFPFCVSVASNPATDAQQSDDYIRLEWLEAKLDEYLQKAGASSGTGGADGGYYTPAVSQLNANTMSISFTASKEGMPVVAEKNITLPAGKNGDTPVRGTDYWTDDDIATIKSYVDEAILGGAW